MGHTNPQPTRCALPMVALYVQNEAWRSQSRSPIGQSVGENTMHGEISSTGKAYRLVGDNISVPC